MMLVTSLISLAAAAGVAAATAGGSTNATFVAQEIAQISACGITCLTQSIPRAGCSLLNTTCQCESTELVTITTSCMLQNCTLVETLELAEIQAAICERPYESRNHFIWVMTIVLATLVNSAVFFRLIARYALHRGFGWDDWFIAAATVSAACFTYFGVKLQQHGFGEHIWSIDISDVPKLLYWFWVCEIIYVLTLSLVKVSILFFYLQVFPDRSFRMLCYAAVAFVTASCISFTLVTAFQCTPISYSWNKIDGHGKCVNYNTTTWVQAGVNIFQDILIVALPINELRYLQLGIKKKISVGFMFGLGFFVCITSMIRLSTLRHFGLTSDPTWDNVPTTFWSTLEATAAIVCACLPAIRAGVVRLCPKVWYRLTSTNSVTFEIERPTETTVIAAPQPSKKWTAIELAHVSSLDDEESGPDSDFFRSKPLPQLPTKITTSRDSDEIFAFNEKV